MRQQYDFGDQESGVVQKAYDFVYKAARGFIDGLYETGQEFYEQIEQVFSGNLQPVNGLELSVMHKKRGRKSKTRRSKRASPNKRKKN